MYHYVYKVKSNSGKYYVGRHSTKNLNDGYLGSGKWVKSLPDKKELTKEILEFCQSFDELLERERYYISENIGKQDCMNFNNNPIGFPSGELNIAHDANEKERRRKRMLEDNPAKREEVRAAMSASQKGRPSDKKGIKLSEEARKKISESRIGIKYSEEGKKKLSEARKRDFNEEKKAKLTFSGKEHSDETKQHLKEVASNRTKYACIHCGVLATKQNLTRWHNDNCKKISCEQNGL